MQIVIDEGKTGSGNSNKDHDQAETLLSQARNMKEAGGPVIGGAFIGAALGGIPGAALGSLVGYAIGLATAVTNKH